MPKKLHDLIVNKDYGRYGENGDLHVNFLTNNDITGGNSGSPVINGDGHLIGIAFDGNWDSMVGDLSYQKKVQRTISVDIRYVLWFIDKYAGADTTSSASSTSYRKKNSHIQQNERRPEKSGRFLFGEFLDTEIHGEDTEGHRDFPVYERFDVVPDLITQEFNSLPLPKHRYEKI